MKAYVRFGDGPRKECREVAPGLFEVPLPDAPKYRVISASLKALPRAEYDYPGAPESAPFEDPKRYSFFRCWLAGLLFWLLLLAINISVMGYKHLAAEEKPWQLLAGFVALANLTGPFLYLLANLAFAARTSKQRFFPWL